VASIPRDLILEHTGAALTVFERTHTDALWSATALTVDESLTMPEIGIEIPVAEFHDDVGLPAAETQPP
jgi:hypothetical protein